MVIGEILLKDSQKLKIENVGKWCELVVEYKNGNSWEESDESITLNYEHLNMLIENLKKAKTLIEHK